MSLLPFLKSNINKITACFNFYVKASKESYFLKLCLKGGFFSKFLKFITLLVVHFYTTWKEDTRACKNEIFTTITCFSKVVSFSKSLFSFVFDSASFSSNSFLQWLSISCTSLSPNLSLFSLSLFASTCLPWKQKKIK